MKPIKIAGKNRRSNQDKLSGKHGLQIGVFSPPEYCCLNG